MENRSAMITFVPDLVRALSGISQTVRVWNVLQLAPGLKQKNPSLRCGIQNKVNVHEGLVNRLSL